MTDIPVVPAIDFSTEEMENGDQGAFVTKMEAYMTKLENWSLDIYNQSVALKANNAEMNEALVAMQNSINASAASVDASADAVAESTELVNGAVDFLNDSALNLVPHNGSMQSGDLDTTGFLRSDAGVFDVTGLSALFTTYNGSGITDSTEIGRFCYNSVTYGGSATAVAGTVSAFADKMFVALSSDIQKRRVPDFSIAQVLAGDGESGIEYGGYYRFVATNLMMYHAINGKVTFSFWYRPLDSHAVIRATTTERIWVDGELLTTTGGDEGSAYHKLAQNAVRHICVAIDADYTLDYFTLDLMASPGSRNQFAVPRIAPGSFQMEPHFGPSRSYVP